MDNSDVGAGKSFQVLSGTWGLGSSLSDKYGADYRYCGSTSSSTPTARARWSCTILGEGLYEVYAWWPAYSTRPSNTPYVVKDGAVELGTVRVDQRVNGGRWNLLGAWWFSAGGHAVEIHNGGTGSGKTVAADAVRFVLAGATTTTVSTTTTTTLPVGEAIVDNTESGVQRRFEVVLGTWGTGTSLSDKYGVDYRYAGSTASEAPSALVRWRCGDLGAGMYEVYAWWPAYSTRPGNVPYVIKNGQVELAVVRVDQRVNGGRWNLLGSWWFDAGGHVVEMHNGLTGTGKTLAADAVRFVPVGAVTTTSTVSSTTSSSTTTTTLPSVECVVDNTDSLPDRRFEVVSGAWTVSTWLSGYWGTNYLWAAASRDAESARGRWSASGLPAGRYDVYAWWVGDGARSKRVPYVIKDGSTELAVVRVDQTRNSGQWNLLGTYDFSAGGHVVEIHNGQTQAETTEKYITADAVRFVKR